MSVCSAERSTEEGALSASSFQYWNVFSACTLNMEDKRGKIAEVGENMKYVIHGIM